MKKENGMYVKTLYCKDLFQQEEGDSIFDLFLLSEAAPDNENTEWRDLILEDISGTVKAKVWKDSLKFPCTEYVGKLVLVKGSISHKGGISRLMITGVFPLKEDTPLTDEKGNLYSCQGVLRCMDPSVALRYKDKIRSVIKALKEEDLRELVMRILDDDMLNRMERLPVHIKGHHSYAGGLLEHTMEVAQGVYYYMTNTMEMRKIAYDRNLAVAGALLHDLPEAMLMEEHGHVFRKRKEADLYGSACALHIMLDRNRQGLDDRTLGLLLHIMESAHGYVKPRCMEAELVRLVNRMSIFADQYENAFLWYAMFYGEEPDCVYTGELDRELVRVGRRKDEEGKKNTGASEKKGSS